MNYGLHSLSGIKLTLCHQLKYFILVCLPQPLVVLSSLLKQSASTVSGEQHALRICICSSIHCTNELHRINAAITISYPCGSYLIHTQIHKYTLYTLHSRLARHLENYGDFYLFQQSQYKSICTDQPTHLPNSKSQNKQTLIKGSQSVIDELQLNLRHRYR